MKRDLIRAIEDFEEKFSSVKQKSIDINQENWLEEARKVSLEFQKDIEPEISKLRDFLFNAFASLDNKSRREIMETISKTKVVLNNLSIPLTRLSSSENKNRAFEQALILETLLDLKPDYRDRLLYLNELITLAGANGISVKDTIQKILPYTDECNQNNPHCIRKYLMNYI